MKSKQFTPPVLECHSFSDTFLIQFIFTMDRWQNKVAVVTGASSGIGAAVAQDLVKAGLIVVALARREERLRENKGKLEVPLRARYHPIKCDVTKDAEVKAVFSWVENNLGGVDILVNNAGIARLGVQLSDPDNTQVINDVVDTNIKATAYCVREAFISMKTRNFDGHIIIVNSVLGHKNPMLPQSYSFNIYPASKFAVTAMVETYRQEFVNAGTKVKITVSKMCN